MAGINGKTTTARMVDELLRGFGLRVGRFTSPHLQSVRERIVLDGEPVSAERFVETYDDIAPYVQMVDAAGEHPMSFFEVVVGMAYATFAEAPVDVAVIEVGMGGTWDATNVVDARVAVVTPVALDHAEYLGPDVGTIAGEKAGVIKRDAVAAFLGAGAATGPIDQETVRAAFAAVRSPGRLERVRTSPTVLVDAAHNPAGMAATVEAVRESFDFTRLVGVVGVVHGKDVEGMLRELETVCAELVVTQNSSSRAMPADELGALAVDVFGADRVSVQPRLADAITQAIELAEAAPDRPRAARALGGAAAAVLLLEGIAVLFVPRGIAQSGPGLTGSRLILLLVLAAVLILASGLQRRPQGTLVGTALQVPLLLTGLLNGVMWFLGGLFVLVWLYLLQLRKELLGSSF